MMKFKDEQGNIVTPRKGDYVFARDITDEAMHNKVRDEMRRSGLSIAAILGKWVDIGRGEFVIIDCDGDLLWSDLEGDRRIIPCQQTLFEAALHASDGTRFRLIGQEIVKQTYVHGDWTLLDSLSKPVMACYMGYTDFEQLPAEPKKRKAERIFIHDIKVPKDMAEDLREKFELIGRLMQWEGAQIGKPGFNFYGDGTGAYFEYYSSKYEVTFQNEDQCIAAHKAECPELFEVKS